MSFLRQKSNQCSNSLSNWQTEHVSQKKFRTFLTVVWISYWRKMTGDHLRSPITNDITILQLPVFTLGQFNTHHQKRLRLRLDITIITASRLWYHDFYILIVMVCYKMGHRVYANFKSLSGWYRLICKIGALRQIAHKFWVI